jgi:hypothetical protein
MRDVRIYQAELKSDLHSELKSTMNNRKIEPILNRPEIFGELYSKSDKYRERIDGMIPQAILNSDYVQPNGYYDLISKSMRVWTYMNANSLDETEESMMLQYIM